LRSTTPPLRFDPNEDRRWLAGMTLREALDIIVALDRRYACSETQQTIVVRPLLPWNEAEHFLVQKVGPFLLEEEVSVEHRIQFLMMQSIAALAAARVVCRYPPRGTLKCSTIASLDRQGIPVAIGHCRVLG